MKRQKLVCAMKAINFIALFFFLLFFANSCNKNEEITTKDIANEEGPQMREDDHSGVQNLEITQINGRLVFQNEQHFEHTMNNLSNKNIEELTAWEDEKGFTSMRKHFELNGLNEVRPIEDDAFATVLNPDGIMQVGNRVFNVDKTSEFVYLMFWKNEQDEGLVENLKAKQEVPGKIIAVSMETDVAWTANPQAPAASRDCSEECYEFRPDDKILIKEGGKCTMGSNDALYEYYYDSKKHLAEATVCYYKYGTYAVLKVRTDHSVYDKDGNNPKNSKTNMRFTSIVYQYQKRCKREVTGTASTTQEYKHTIKYNIYSGTRCLSKFTVTQTTEGDKKGGGKFTVTAAWNGGY